MINPNYSAVNFKKILEHWRFDTLKNAIEQALMSDIDRQAMQYKYLHGLKTKEIAAKLLISEVQAKAALKRGRIAIFKFLDSS